MYIDILGSLGDKFYIILQGQVSVLIPNPEIKEVHQQIENSRKFIDEKRNQLKDLQTLIDQDKKHKEDCEKLLQEELER